MLNGEIMPQVDGFLYGDGSGYFQDRRECRVATFAIVRMALGAEDEQAVESRVTGNIGGWFPTVPRGELRALIEFMRHGGSARYVGDCSYVINGAEGGVSQRLKSSTSSDADLWRRLDELAADHGAPPTVRKTRAHRSRSDAAADDQDGLEHWIGNRAADRAAKDLAKTRVDAAEKEKRMVKAEAEFLKIIRCVAQGAAMAIDSWPENAPRQAERASRLRGADPLRECDEDGDDRHALKRLDNGRFECAVCRAVAYSARGARRMATAICPGSVMRSVHETHELQRSHGVLWCKLCGSYSTRWARQLMGPCPRKARSQAQRNVLRRLVNGLAPTTAGYLGQAAQAAGLPAAASDVITHVQGAMAAERPAEQPRPDAHDDERRDADRGDDADADAAHGDPLGDGADVRREEMEAMSAHGRARGPAARDAAEDAVVRPSTYGYRRLMELNARGRHLSCPPAPLAVGPSTSPVVVEESEACRGTRLSPRPQLAVSASWIRRVAIRRTPAPSSCGTCETAVTRLRCSSCSRGLCIACARGVSGCRTCQGN